MNPPPLTHHDPAVRELIHKAQREAWDDGWAVGVLDELTDLAPSENPYGGAA